MMRSNVRRMRIAHIILPDASEYERKSQRADQSSLSEKHDVTVTPIESIAKPIHDSSWEPFQT